AGAVVVPAYLYPGVREDVVAIPIGQGHTAYGRYAKDLGANPYRLLPKQATGFGGVAHYASVTIRPTGGHEKLAKTEGSNRQMGRGIAQAVLLADAGAPSEHHEEGAAPIPERVEKAQEHWAEEQQNDTKSGNYAGAHPRWAMAIDLSRCTGC